MSEARLFAAPGAKERLAVRLAQLPEPESPLGETTADLGAPDAREIALEAIEECAPEALPDDALYLVATSEGLELRSADAPHARGVRAELRAPRPGARPTRRQPLGRAMGRGDKRIFDATAGLGEDALLLAGLGHSVVAAERSPVVAALLAEGLERARAATDCASLVSRIELVRGDARSWLAELEPAPQVVYLDPMFPPRRKRSALPPRRIQLLRRLLAADADAESLLHAALAVATERVVVKRPREAPPLLASPHAQYSGKLVRYDCYRVAPGGPAPRGE